MEMQLPGNRKTVKSAKITPEKFSCQYLITTLLPFLCAMHTKKKGEKRKNGLSGFPCTNMLRNGFSVVYGHVLCKLNNLNLILTQLLKHDFKELIILLLLLLSFPFSYLSQTNDEYFAEYF